MFKIIIYPTVFISAQLLKFANGADDTGVIVS